MKGIRPLHKAWLTILPPPYLPPTEIKVLELSESRMRFECPCPLPAERFIFNLKFKNGKSLERAGRLKRLKRIDRGYRIDIEFARRLK